MFQFFNHHLSTFQPFLLLSFPHSFLHLTTPVRDSTFRPALPVAMYDTAHRHHGYERNITTPMYLYPVYSPNHILLVQKNL